MSKLTDVPLVGGRTNPEVVQRGNRVHRSRHINSEFVRLLLTHFQRVGFHAVPRSFGMDELGRDVFEFVEGDVPTDLTYHSRRFGRIVERTGTRSWV